MGEIGSGAILLKTEENMTKWLKVERTEFLEVVVSAKVGQNRFPTHPLLIPIYY